jgi:hypothetical protein
MIDLVKVIFSVVTGVLVTLLWVYATPTDPITWAVVIICHLVMIPMLLVLAWIDKLDTLFKS